MPNPDTVVTELQRDESAMQRECAKCPALLHGHDVVNGRAKVRCALLNALVQMDTEELERMYSQITQTFLGEEQPLVEEYRETNLRDFWVSGEGGSSTEVQKVDELEEGQEKTLPECEALKSLQGFVRYVISVRDKQVWMAKQSAGYEAFSKAPKGF